MNVIVFTSLIAFVSVCFLLCGAAVWLLNNMSIIVDETLTGAATVLAAEKQ